MKIQAALHCKSVSLPAGLTSIRVTNQGTRSRVMARGAKEVCSPSSDWTPLFVSCGEWGWRRTGHNIHKIYFLFSIPFCPKYQLRVMTVTWQIRMQPIPILHHKLPFKQTTFAHTQYANTVYKFLLNISAATRHHQGVHTPTYLKHN
jgi:hypothetical protein